MRTKRIDLIETYIIKNKSVTLDTLCEEFAVSKNTIRRDIDTLLERGTIKKVYGGVTAVDSSPSVPQLIPYNERNTLLPDEKDSICRLCAQFIEDNDIIYIDTGTTCLNLIDYISEKECTILTNSLQLFLKAVQYPKLTVISMPGVLKRETLSFAGTEVNEYLKTYNINKAFMACTGVTIKNGLTNASLEEYIVKKAVMENSQYRYLLADHTKFGRASLMTYWPLTQVDHIITDQELPAEYKETCLLNGVGISVAY